ncbi:unnamed protein product [Meganyctiphanes norvegica]|uniref:Uncharacterized protein n=1 Tax=Meganyctiphanes norvegica TaxID=48144 RepID=A0AAV2R1A0_MEGNR
MKSRPLSLDPSILGRSSRATGNMVPSAPVHIRGPSPSKSYKPSIQPIMEQKDPVLVPPYLCTHQGTNGQMCIVCKKDGEENVKRQDRKPDFTMNMNGSPHRPAKRCKCRTITILTTCLSLFVIVLIMSFVIYDEVYLKKQNNMPVEFRDSNMSHSVKLPVNPVNFKGVILRHNVKHPVDTINFKSVKVKQNVKHSADPINFKGVKVKQNLKHPKDPNQFLIFI